MRIGILMTVTLFLALILTSCLRWRSTPEYGVRLVDSKDFKYYKKKFRNPNSIIDTSYAYKLISGYDWRFDSNYCPKISCSYIRFFGGGQVLFFDCNNDSIEKYVNNPNSGIPGYYTVKDNQVRIERWDLNYRGQLCKYFGIVVNNNKIKFYEQSVQYCFGSYKCLENQKMFTIWEKQTNLKLYYYQPDW